MLTKAKAFIQPFRSSATSDYTFEVFCESCPQWPWPPKDQKPEAYAVHICYEGGHDFRGCRFFAYMEADSKDGVWIYCKSEKWREDADK